MGVNKVKGQKCRKGYRRLQKGTLQEVVGRMVEQSGRGNVIGLEGGQERRAELSRSVGVQSCLKCV